jgi:hypothetical protein
VKALALLALLAAACGDGWPEGRYLFVDGDAANIEFDRVELYFGKTVGAALPHGVPGYVRAQDGEEELLERVEVGSEGGEVIGRTTTHVDLFLPAGPADRVGEYVLAIAFLGDQPRGIGEVRQFAKDWADITRYQIVLEPFPTDTQVFDRWGPSDEDEKKCVRWTRDQLTTAIVPDEDRDCDGYKDADVDCDPMTYCSGAAAGCVSAIPCVSDDNGCTLGTCVNTQGASRVCTPQVCLPAAACRAGCPDKGNATEALDCVLEDPSTHGEDLRIPVTPQQALCKEPYFFFIELPGGATCIEGPVMTSAFYQSDDPVPFGFYAYADLGGCKIKMEPLVPDAIFDGTYHILVWLAPSSAAGATPRSVVVGMQPELKACGPVTITIPELYLEGC